MHARHLAEQQVTTLRELTKPMVLVVAGVLFVVGLGIGSGSSVVEVGAAGLTALMATAGLAARFGLRRVILGLALVGTVMAPWVGVRAGPQVAASDVAFAVASGLAIIYRLQDRRFSFTPYKLGIIAITLIVAGGLVGTVFAADAMSSLSQLARFSASTISIVVLFVLLSPTRKEVVYFALAFVLGALISAVVALLFADAIRGRPAGLSHHSNHLGLVLFMAIGILLGISESGRRRLVMGALVLLCWASVVGGSRASIVGVFFTGLIFLWSAREIVLLRRVLIAVAVATAVWSFGWVSIPAHNAIGRVLGDEPVAKSNAARAEVGSAAIERILEHAVTGSGFGSVLEAHSVYLQLWQGGGLLALAGVTMLWVVAVHALRRGRQRRDRLLLGLASAYLAYLIVALVGNQLWNRYLWVIFALMIAAKAAPDQATTVTAGSKEKVIGARVQEGSLGEERD